MADFNPSFGDGATLRAPTATERELGFSCGPADRELFNYLFNLLDGQIAELAAEAGVASLGNGDKTVLKRSITSLLASLSGEGGSEEYLLLTQARSRMPIYPEIQTADGRIGVYSPAVGTVRLPGGVGFLHRGIALETTVETDFATVPSKTYHLRWRYNGGTPAVTLFDLADTGYNPTIAAETSVAFDSAYDDMLIARIVTNSSNVATVTTLANKQILRATGEELAPKGSLTWVYMENQAAPSAINEYRSVSLNWARSPDSYLTAINDMRPAGADLNGEFNAGVRTLSRYALAVWAQGDPDTWLGWAARA